MRVKDNIKLRKVALSGVSWTAFSSIIGIIINLVQIAILARILSAEDFGLMAIVLVVINFSNIFVDMGFSKAVVQKQNSTNTQLSTLFWLNVLAGFLLFLVIWFSAPWIANFYNAKDLTSLLKIISVIFLIQPLGQLPLALLQKHFYFREIEIRNTIARIISFIVIIVLAYMGYGVSSLVYGQIVLISVGTIIIWFAGRKIFHLHFVFSMGQVIDYFKFGVYQMGDQITTYFSSQIDTLIIGKLLDTYSLGLYSITKDLVSKPMQVLNPIITKVTFPLIASINDDKNRTKQVYINIVKIVTFVNFPIYAGIALFGLEAVEIMLGSKWLESVFVLKILAFVYLLRSMGNPSGSYMQAIGKPHISFYWNFSMMFIMPVFFIVGSTWGINGVAIAFLLYQFLGQFPNWYFVLKKGADIKFLEYIDSFGIPFIATGIAYILALLLNYDNINYIYVLAIKFIVFVGVYVAINFLFNKFIKLEIHKFINLWINNKKQNEI